MDYSGINFSNPTYFINDRANLNKKTVETTSNPQTQKSGMSTVKKVLIGAGSIGSATLAVIYGVKKHQVLNPKNIQKAFQEIFMREDITVEQAIKMKKRYAEIEKIKDKEEYTKALFETAKENYGFKDVDIPLNIEELANPGAIGGAPLDPTMGIFISPKADRYTMLNTIHHELRHFKQHYYAMCIDKEKMTHAIAKRLCNNEESAQEVIQNAEKMLGELTPDKVPEKYKAYAEKCIGYTENYHPLLNRISDKDAYLTDPLEVDARSAAKTADKYVYGRVIMDTYPLDKPLI